LSRKEISCYLLCIHIQSELTLRKKAFLFPGASIYAWHVEGLVSCIASCLVQIFNGFYIRKGKEPQVRARAVLEILFVVYRINSLIVQEGDQLLLVMYTHSIRINLEKKSIPISWGKYICMARGRSRELYS